MAAARRAARRARRRSSDPCGLSGLPTTHFMSRRALGIHAVAAGSCVALAAFLSECAPHPRATEPSIRERTGPRLAIAESIFADLRDQSDRIKTLVAMGQRESADGTPLSALAARHDSLRADLAPRLAAVDSTSLADQDRRALRIMRATLDSELGPATGKIGPPASSETHPDCQYAARQIARAP